MDQIVGFEVNRRENVQIENFSVSQLFQQKKAARPPPFVPNDKVLNDIFSSTTDLRNR